MSRKWSDGYGSQWYRHFDGKPPEDDDNDYYWTGSQWAIDYEHMDSEPVAQLVRASRS